MSAPLKNNEQDQDKSEDALIQDTPPKDSSTPQTVEERTRALALLEGPSELLDSAPDFDYSSLFSKSSSESSLESLHHIDYSYELYSEFLKEDLRWLELQTDALLRWVQHWQRK